MKLGYLLFTSLVIFFFGISIRAQITLDPGDAQTFSNQLATGGAEGDNGNVCYSSGHSFNLSTKILKAEVNPGGCGIGKGEAYASLYYDFQISETPETNNNTIGAWISYNVLWQGYQALLGIASLSFCSGMVEMTLIDQSTNQVLRNDVLHDHQLHQYSYDFLAGGFNLDSDNRSNNYSVVLRRGHVYRIKLTLTVMVAWTTLSISDYMDGFAGGGDGRVELTNLLVKVGLDDKETLEKLAMIDSLESRIDTLEYRLEHHYHTYLTGRGAGHNNTEANTTISIFEESLPSNTDPPQYETQPDLDSDDNENINLTPEVFSLSQNYPNPFNPSTRISFAIPTQEFVTIKVYDVLGRKIKELMNEAKPAGYYEVNFNASELPSGTYIYEIRAGSFVETKKMILLK